MTELGPSMLSPSCIESLSEYWREAKIAEKLGDRALETSFKISGSSLS